MQIKKTTKINENNKVYVTRIPREIYEILGLEKEINWIITPNKDKFEVRVC